MNKATLAAAFAGALTAVGLSLALAPHAHADTQQMDRQFVAILDADGIGNTQGLAAEINAGRGMCVLRMNGQDEASVISYVYQQSGLSQTEATEFVQAAESVYCPGFMGHAGSTVA